MKIGFLGNTNNFPFAIARALRSMDHEVVFLVDRIERLYRPEFRFPEISTPYPDWVIDLAPMNYLRFWSAKRRRALSILRECDAVILNDSAPSLASRIGRPAIVLLTGSDLEELANLRRIETPANVLASRSWYRLPRELLKRQLRWTLCLDQREGIRSARAVNYYPPGAVASADDLLAEIGVDLSRRMTFLLSALDLISFTPPPHHDPLRLFCGTRLNWKRPIPAGFVELDYKGTDTMIRGLGLFWRKTGQRLGIRLVRKGMHVAETEQLLREEGIEEQVTWRDEMTQVEMNDELRQADIVFEQFGATRMFGMAGLDAMAAGRPVIGDIDPEPLRSLIGDADFPLCRARNAEEVCDQLVGLRSAAERERIGRASRQFVETFCSAERGARMCIQRLDVVDSSIAGLERARS